MLLVTLGLFISTVVLGYLYFDERTDKKFYEERFYVAEEKLAQYMDFYADEFTKRTSTEKELARVVKQREAYPAAVLAAVKHKIKKKTVGTKRRRA